MCDLPALFPNLTWGGWATAAFFLSLTHAFTHSLIRSCIHSFTCSFTHSLIHTFIHSFAHACIHSFTRIHSFAHSCIHSITHAFTHSCIHSLYQMHCFSRAVPRGSSRATWELVGRQALPDSVCALAGPLLGGLDLTAPWSPLWSPSMPALS